MTDTQRLIAKALALRDESCAQITPPIDRQRIPFPLPDNVQGIPHQILTQQALEITSLDPEVLLEAIRHRKYTCVTVTRAFLRRAALAQSLVNCVTELLPELALERAAYLDSLDEPLGPLHGLPISIKEHHGMFGRMKTCGFVAFIEADSGGVSGVNDVLWKAGAVFYVRTTMPQSGMHIETSSNIYGVTVNPWNRSLTPGGSSGGEAALIALRGSVLGVGGDSGGSIRFPAACTGIYGFKPTTGRVSRRGAKVVQGGDGIVGSHGPMSTSRAGLTLFMKTYLDAQPWRDDPTLVPLPWRSVAPPTSRWKIAIMWDDGVVRPHPPVRRALRQVVDALRKNHDQFEVVNWKPWDHDRARRLAMALYFEDGGRAIQKTLADGGEEPRHLTEWMLQDENVQYRTVEEVWALKAQRNEYRQRYNDLWTETGLEDGHPVDAILCPTGPGAAPPHENGKYWAYTCQWNLLDYPSLSFPVTRVDPTVDLREEDYVPKNEQDRFNHELYDPARYVGAPIGLQLVTRRYEDEKCLDVLEAVEEAMGRV